MCISGVHLPPNIFIGSFSHERPSRPGSPSSIIKTESFNLQIVDDSVGVPPKSQYCNIPTGHPYFSFILYYNELPLEAFSLPGWSNKWFSDLNVMALDKGMKNTDHHQRQYDALSAKKKDELSEYTFAVLTCIAEKLIKYGIKDGADYGKFMQDDELSEEVHQAVTNCLAGNPRIMELMQSFGLTLY